MVLWKGTEIEIKFPIKLLNPKATRIYSKRDP